MSAALRSLDEPRPDRVGAAAFILSLRARGIFDLGVLRAMETVPRELFAPRRYGDLARSDVALPLPCGQTMSAPATVALMLAALEVRPGAHVREIGSGSGYVTAILARMGAYVHAFECRPVLAESARERLAAAGLARVTRLDACDGLAISPDEGPYDRILVNGTLPCPPAHLLSRLRANGRLVAAVAVDGAPRLLTVIRAADGQLTHLTGARLRLSPLVADPAAGRPPETEI